MALKTLPLRLKAVRLSRLKPPNTEGGFGGQFYQSHEWREFRDRIVAKRGRHCQKCGAIPQGRIHCDHIIELRDGGGALDERNVILTCVPCHNTKTAQEKRSRAMARHP